MPLGLIPLLLSFVLVAPSEAVAAANPIDRKPGLKPLHGIQRHLEEYTPQDGGRVPIQVGEQASGELGESDFRSSRDGTRVDIYEFGGHRGDVVTVSVQSGDFDPLIWMLESQNRQLIGGDDDSGDDWNAKLTTVLPHDGHYLLAVNSYGRLGRYEVRITEEPALVLPAGSSNAKRRAVLIGINDYPGARNDLSAPVHDVDAVFEFLVGEAGFDSTEIVVIKDSYATRQNIARSVRAFLGSAPADGTVVLYFSGHGVQLAASGGQEADGRDEALYLADGGYLVDDELRELVNCIEGRSVTVIVDACYSGGINRGNGKKNVEQEDVKAYLESAKIEPAEEKACSGTPVGSGREVNLVISASEEHEEAWEWGEWEDIAEPRSVFTRYFIEQASYALMNTPDIAVESLIEQVSRDTTRFTEEKKGAFQHARVVDYSRREARIGDIFGLSNSSGQPDVE